MGDPSDQSTRGVSPHPLAWPSKTAGVKRMPFWWLLLALWWKVLLRVCQFLRWSEARGDRFEACFLILRVQTLFLSRFVDDVVHRVVFVVAVSCAWRHRCEVAEAVKDWATQGALCALGEEWDVVAVSFG